MSKVFQKYNCFSKARCTATLLLSAAGKSKHHSTTVLCHLVAVSEMTPNARPKEQMKRENYSHHEQSGFLKPTTHEQWKLGPWKNQLDVEESSSVSLTGMNERLVNRLLSWACLVTKRRCRKIAVIRLQAPLVTCVHRPFICAVHITGRRQMEKQVAHVGDTGRETWEGGPGTFQEPPVNAFKWLSAWAGLWNTSPKDNLQNWSQEFGKWAPQPPLSSTSVISPSLVIHSLL